MRNFNSFMHPLALIVFIVVVQRSWSNDPNTADNFQRDPVQNPVKNEHWKAPAGVNHANPSSSSSIFSRNSKNSKQFDEKISNIIAENALHFGHSLGLELAAQDPHATQSEIFSPLSIMSALSLLMLGAKGKSYQELKQLLGLDSDIELAQYPSKYHEELGLMLSDVQASNINKGGISKRPNANWRFTKLKSAPIRSSGRTQPIVNHIIRVANGLFVQSGYTLNPDYSQVIKSIYDTELTQLDFQGNNNREARDHINKWVNDATFGKIPQIINGEIDKSTNVILASALYFKAFWETSFFLQSTFEDNFFPDGIHNPPIKVQMMPTGGVFPYYNAKEYDCRIIGLPYKGNETTMYVIQPNNSTRQRLRELQQSLTAYKINQMIDNMVRKTTVMVLPKMHFTRTLTLKSILKNMDIRSIFLNGYSDLSLIGGAPISSYATAPPQAAPIKPTANPTVVFESIHRTMPIYQPPTMPIYQPPTMPIYQPPTMPTYQPPTMPTYQPPTFHDRFEEPALIFSRFGEMEGSTNYTTNYTNYTTTERPTVNHTTTFEGFTSNYTTTFERSTNNDTTTFERSTNNDTTTTTTKMPSKREKRQVPNLYSDPITASLSNLEADRLKVDSYRGDLFVDNIIHKVDFAVDEQGTEAAAATLTYLHRSGTDVVFRGDTPFLIVIRHDPTKLPLFYGIINKPEL